MMDASLTALLQERAVRKVRRSTCRALYQQGGFERLDPTE